MKGSNKGKGGGSSSSSSNNTNNSTTKGESHRIYWQQWPSSAATNKGISNKPTVSSRRDLITSSAAIRISRVGARAQDVTNLLCETLNLKSIPPSTIKKNNNTNNNNKSKDFDEKDNNNNSLAWDLVQDAWEQDSLVLVGTLYSLPLQYVRFEHEHLLQQQQQQQEAAAASSRKMPILLTRNDPPFHVIKTLKGTENPIQVRDDMIQHLESILQQTSAAQTAAAAAATTTTRRKTTSISPKLQWYFVPGVNHPSSPIPSYIDLDGYSTSMEEEEDDDDDDGEDHEENEGEDYGYCNEDSSQHDTPVDSLLLSLALQDKNDHLLTTSKDDDNNDDHDEQTANNKQKEGTTTHLVSSSSTTTTTTANTTTTTTNTTNVSEKERIFKKERQLYYELSLCQSSLQQDCLSGYLLKQSMKDPHVWKRMYCVLTDDHLWYNSRIYTRLDDDDEEENQNQQKQRQQKQPELYSFAKHRRMGLTRALLLQPTPDKPTAPLFRTPFAFEVIDSNGSAHRFRASNPENYKRWVMALQSRIVQAYENSLLEHAELIVRDETEARNKRFRAVTVQPLWEMLQQQYNIIGQTKAKANNANNTNNNRQMAAVAATVFQDKERHNPIDAPTLQILRFGIEVTQYREHCRHIEAILPAKYPVLAMTDSTPELKLNGSTTSSQNGSAAAAAPDAATSTFSGAFRLDTKTQALIKSAWDDAVRLGSRATKLAVALQAASGNTSTKMPRSLETICQHLEYVITGNFRGGGGAGNNGKNSSSSSKPANLRPDNTRQYPPPVDLFDQLLVELQAGASVVSARARLDNNRSSSLAGGMNSNRTGRLFRQGGNHAQKPNG